MFEHSTLCIMYFLGAYFTELHAFKPATSKPANSEVYLVAKGFKVSSDLSLTGRFLLLQLSNPSHLLQLTSTVSIEYEEKVQMCWSSESSHLSVAAP